MSQQVAGGRPRREARVEFGIGNKEKENIMIFVCERSGTQMTCLESGTSDELFHRPESSRLLNIPNSSLRSLDKICRSKLENNNRRR